MTNFNEFSKNEVMKTTSDEGSKISFSSNGIDDISHGTMRKRAGAASSTEEYEGNQTKEVPPMEFVENKSLKEISELCLNEVGDDTGQLSDSPDDDDGYSHWSGSSSSLHAWITRISPLIRNRQVRLFSLVNFILSVVNLVLFMAIMVLGILFIFQFYMNERMKEKDYPCFFKYEQWSQCSQPCRKNKTEPYPYMTRKVNLSTVVRSRGSYEPCNEEDFKKVQKAPCNTHLCAVKLSSINFTKECFYYDQNKEKEGGCYRIRLPPLEDQLIKIDTLDLIQHCPDDQCGTEIQ